MPTCLFDSRIDLLDSYLVTWGERLPCFLADRDTISAYRCLCKNNFLVSLAQGQHDTESLPRAAAPRRVQQAGTDQSFYVGKRGLRCCTGSRELITLLELTGGGGRFFFACENFGRMFENSFPACAFLLLLLAVEISSRKLIPLFRPG